MNKISLEIFKLWKIFQRLGCRDLNFNEATLIFQDKFDFKLFANKFHYMKNINDNSRDNSKSWFSKNSNLIRSRENFTFIYFYYYIW